MPVLRLRERVVLIFEVLSLNFLAASLKLQDNLICNGIKLDNEF